MRRRSSANNLSACDSWKKRSSLRRHRIFQRDYDDDAYADEVVKLRTMDMVAEAFAGAQWRFATIAKDDPNLILSCVKDIFFRRKI